MGVGQVGVWTVGRRGGDGELVGLGDLWEPFAFVFRWCGGAVTAAVVSLQTFRGAGGWGVDVMGGG